MSLTLQTLDPVRGAQWVAEGLRLFRRRPLAFSLLMVVFTVAASLLSLLPLIGAPLMVMASPLLSLGFMVASQSALLEGPVDASMFLEPLRTSPARRRQLLGLCALYGLLATLLLLGADSLSEGGLTRAMQWLSQRQHSDEEMRAFGADSGVAAGMLLAALTMTTLSVPFWHAPALVHWGGQTLAQSLFSSTLAVWRNAGAFVVYALAWAGVGLLLLLAMALLTALLGRLALPVAVAIAIVLPAAFYVSLVFSFNDCFGMPAERA